MTDLDLIKVENANLKLKTQIAGATNSSEVDRLKSTIQTLNAEIQLLKVKQQTLMAEKDTIELKSQSGSYF